MVSPDQIESMYTEPLNIALSDFKSDHHPTHSFDDLNKIIWYVCKGNKKVHKFDPKSRFRKEKVL